MNRPSFKEEKIFWSKGIDFVIGIDEVGRGAFAGPIVAAGVVFDKDTDPQTLCDVNDSKMLKPQMRKRCAEVVRKEALYCAVEEVGVSYINKYGIGKANTAVFRKVLTNLLSQIGSSNYYILIDGFHKKYLPGGLNKQKGIVKGDSKSLSIASASILAKVYRDNLMKKHHKNYPCYMFGKNKGYGTGAHLEAIRINGITDMHRKAFIATWLSHFPQETL